MRVEILAGTSGFAYKQWKGSFYPEDLPDAGMLRYYADRFRTVEINNTFYRMPNESTLQHWREQVSDGFRFVLKASQRITHHKRLKADAADPLTYFLTTSALLGDARGPLLFQLPPNLKKDVGRLESFLTLLPSDVNAAFEFRHESWHDDDVYAALRAHKAALCIADTSDATTPLIATTDWGYLRLRREAYSDADLVAWVRRIGEQPWTAAWTFFKHEDEGTGPALAKRFEEIASASSEATALPRRTMQLQHRKCRNRAVQERATTRDLS